MVVDGGDDHVWYFYDNDATPNRRFPISTKNIRLVGTKGGDSEFIVNFDLEPISGTLTVDASLPAYDSISASYYYYVNVTDGVDILTQNFMVEFPRPVSDVDIWGQPHYSEINNYPHKLKMNVVLTAESQRNLLTEAMFNAYYFLVIDKNFDSTFGLRAYEGPLWSDEQGSIGKGASYLLPIELMVQQFGRYDATTNEITWGWWEQ
jgi:hypothetical protein